MARVCSTLSDFDSALRGAENKLVVVDFTASWCGPCKMIGPIFEDLARKTTNAVFLKVDVDHNRDVAQRYSIRAMPTFLFIRKGQVVDELRGAQEGRLKALLQKHSGAESSAFSGVGQSISGSSRGPLPPRRPNPFGQDDGQDSDVEEGQRDEVDPDVQAFLATQQAAKGRDVESDRLREERIKSGGVKVTKSRYQKEKEELERRKAEEEQDAARAYEEFAAAMAQGDISRRAGPPTAKRQPIGFVSAGGTKSYEFARPQPHTSSNRDPSSGSGTATATTRPRSKAAIFDTEDDDEDNEQSAPPIKARREPPGRKQGAMNSFLGELQKQQADREEKYKSAIAGGRSVSSILATEGQRQGSRDTGDPLTTNVCVLNLPANISERSLGQFFAQWGDLGTVKIMWPRGEEASGGAGGGITLLRNTRSAGLTGFVCFMRREDAETAVAEADGISWGGAQLHTSWGKAMPKPRHALYLRSAETAARREKDDSPNLKRSRPDGREESSAKRRRRRDRGRSPRSVLQHEFEDTEAGKVIRTVAERIREYGPSFEQLIQDKERDNPRFDWLRQKDSREALYFRTQLDSSFIPTLPVAAFSDEGEAAMYTSDSGEESETQRMKKQRKADTLGHLARQRFEAMLRSITPRRERIARAMAFAIKHASAADVVVDVLTQSLLIPSTPVPRKLARLYVMSDLLHNSSAPLTNAWKFRTAVESRISLIFQHLGDVARSFPGIMKQEGFKNQIRALLDVWDSWLVFAPKVLEELRALLEQGSRGQDDIRHLAPNTEGDALEEDIEGEPLDLVAAQPAAPLEPSGPEGATTAAQISSQNLSTAHRDSPQISAQDAADDDVDGEDLDGVAM